MFRAVLRACLGLALLIGLIWLLGSTLKPIARANDDDAEEDGPSFYAVRSDATAVSIQVALLVAKDR